MSDMREQTKLNSTRSPEVGKPSRTREVIHEAKREIKAVVKPVNGLLDLNFLNVFWLFFIGSIVGLLLEILFHEVMYGEYQARFGLVWGPFSPIYGAGAAILTVFLNRFWHEHNVIIFTAAMIIGSLIEYITSWGMEIFFGAVSWDYTGTFGSLNGRTNFVFGVMWGLLGLIWVRIILPIIKEGFDHIDFKSRLVQAISAVLVVFMIANITFTVGALSRQSERACDIPATNFAQEYFDEHYPDEWMQMRFENMEVNGREA